MKKENFMEQPEFLPEAQSADAQEIIKEVQDFIETGSKFKDSKALLEAYNNLQSDYTKKCQALSAVTKTLADNKQSLPAINADWQLKIDEFLNVNPEATNYLSEISKMVLSDKDVASAISPLDTAWNKIVKQNFKSPKAMAEDEEFVNKYILTNENIKNKIINDYFSQISLSDAPMLISNQQGSKSVMAPKTKPKSLTDAGKTALSLFE